MSKEENSNVGQKGRFYLTKNIWVPQEPIENFNLRMSDMILRRMPKLPLGGQDAIKAFPVLTELKQTLMVGGLDALERTYPATVADNGAKRSVNLPGTIIGDSLALQLGIRVGDPIVLISPASLGGGIGAPRLRRSPSGPRSMFLVRLLR